MNILPLSEEICLEASRIKARMRRRKASKFGLVDGMILASARPINQKLLAPDTDFRKAKDAILL